MKNSLIIFVLLIPVLAISQVDFVKYTNEKHLLEISYPSDWIIRTDIPNRDILIHEPIKSDTVPLSNAELKIQENLDIPLKVRLELLEMQLTQSSSFDESLILEYREVNFADQDALEIIGSSSLGELTIHWKKYLFNKNENFYEWTVSTGENKSANEKEVLEKVLNSLNLK